MPNLQDIKRRIRSVKNTGKITRAMQLVASSKMKRAQQSAISARPYAQMLAEMLSAMPHGESSSLLESSPLLGAREVKTRGILVVSTDMGLAGSLNSDLFRTISSELSGDGFQFVAVGRKASQFLARTKRNLAASFSVSDKVFYREVKPVVSALVEDYLDGKIDTIEVLFPRFINNLRQEVTLTQLAPVPDLASFTEKYKDHATLKPAPISDDTREMLFEPSPAAIIEQIVDLYIRREIHQMILEAKASEYSARMVAMKAATDNAQELERRLSLNYNKARQAAITQELVELSAASLAEE